MESDDDDDVVQTSDNEEEYLVTFSQLRPDSAISYTTFDESRQDGSPARKKRRIDREDSPDELDFLARRTLYEDKENADTLSNMLTPVRISPAKASTVTPDSPTRESLSDLFTPSHSPLFSPKSGTSAIASRPATPTPFLRETSENPFPEGGPRSQSRHSSPLSSAPSSSSSPASPRQPDPLSDPDIVSSPKHPPSSHFPPSSSAPRTPAEDTTIHSPSGPPLRADSPFDAFPESPRGRVFRPRTKAQLNPYEEERRKYRLQLRDHRDAIIRDPGSRRADEREVGAGDADGEYQAPPPSPPRNNGKGKATSDDRHMERALFELYDSEDEDPALKQSRKEARVAERERRRKEKEEKARQRAAKPAKIMKGTHKRNSTSFPVMDDNEAGPSNHRRQSSDEEMGSPSRHSPTPARRLYRLSSPTHSPARSDHMDLDGSDSEQQDNFAPLPSSPRWNHTTIDLSSSPPPGGASLGSASSQDPHLFDMDIDGNGGPIENSDTGSEGSQTDSSEPSDRRPKHRRGKHVFHPMFERVRARGVMPTLHHQRPQKDGELLPGQSRVTVNRTGQRREIIDVEDSDEDTAPQTESTPLDPQRNRNVDKTRADKQRPRSSFRPRTRVELEISSDSESDVLDDVDIDGYMDSDDQDSPPYSGLMDLDPGPGMEHDRYDMMLWAGARRVGGAQRPRRTRTSGGRGGGNKRSRRGETGTSRPRNPRNPRQPTSGVSRPRTAKGHSTGMDSPAPPPSHHASRGPSSAAPAKKRSRPRLDVVVGHASRGHQPTLQGFQKKMLAARADNASSRKNHKPARSVQLPNQNRQTQPRHQYEFLVDDEVVQQRRQVPSPPPPKNPTSRETTRLNRARERLRRQKIRNNDIHYFLTGGPTTTIMTKVNGERRALQPTTGTFPAPRGRVSVPRREGGARRGMRRSIQSVPKNTFETLSSAPPSFIRALSAVPFDEQPQALDQDLAVSDDDDDEPPAPDHLASPASGNTDAVTMFITRPDEGSSIFPEAARCMQGALGSFLSDIHSRGDPGVVPEPLEGLGVILEPSHELPGQLASFVSNLGELVLGIPDSDYGEQAAACMDTVLPAVGALISYAVRSAGTTTDGTHLQDSICRPDDLRPPMVDLVHQFRDAKLSRINVDELTVVGCWWCFATLLRLGFRFQDDADAQAPLRIAFSSLVHCLLQYGRAHGVLPRINKEAEPQVCNWRAAEVWHTLLHLSDDLDFSTTLFEVIGTQITATLESANAPDRVAEVDFIFRLLYSLQSLAHIASDGVAHDGPQIPTGEHWDIVGLALQQVKLDPSQLESDAQEGARDILAKVAMARCYRLASYWDWPLTGQFEAVLRRLIKICSSRRFANVDGEDTDFPKFLEKLDWSLLAVAPVDSADIRAETMFTTLLRLIRHLTMIGNPDASRRAKLLSQIIPKGAVIFSPPPSNAELSAFYNRIAAIAFAIHLDPSHYKDRMQHASSYVDIAKADPTARLAVFRSWMFLGRLLVHIRKPLDELAIWGERMFSAIFEEGFRRPEVQDKGKPRFAAVQIVTAISNVVDMHRKYINNDESLYPDIGLLKIVKTLFDEKAVAGILLERLTRLLRKFFDARDEALHFAETRAPTVNPPILEESQDWECDDGINFDDPAILNDPGLQTALGGQEPGTPLQPSLEDRDRVTRQFIYANVVFRLPYICQREFEHINRRKGKIDNDTDVLARLGPLIDCWLRSVVMMIRGRQIESWDSVYSHLQQHWKSSKGYNDVVTYIGIKIVHLDTDALQARPSFYLYDLNQRGLTISQRDTKLITNIFPHVKRIFSHITPSPLDEAFFSTIIPAAERHHALLAGCSLSGYTDPEGTFPDHGAFRKARVSLAQVILRNLEDMIKPGGKPFTDGVKFVVEMFQELNSHLEARPITASQVEHASDCLEVWRSFISSPALKSISRLQWWIDWGPRTLFGASAG